MGRRWFTAGITVLVLGLAAPAGSAPTGEPLASLTPTRRIAGPDRFGTAAALALDGWPGGSPVAVIVTGENWPDALAAGPVGVSLGAPILLVRRDAIPPDTDRALSQLGVRRVIVVGGPAVVSPEVEVALAARFAVERVFGADRYETAAAVASTYLSVPTLVSVTSELEYEFALFAIALPGDRPLLLVAPGQPLVPAAVAYLETAPDVRSPRGWLDGVGDPNHFSRVGPQVQAMRFGFATQRLLFPTAQEEVIQRSQGEATNPFATPFPPTELALISGANWPDALAASAWIPRGGPARRAALNRPTCVFSELRGFIRRC